MPVSSFLSSTKPIESYSLPGWIASKLIAAPLWWSMGKIGLVDQDGAMSEAKAWKLAQGNWVLLDPLKVNHRLTLFLLILSGIPNVFGPLSLLFANSESGR